MYFGFVPKHFCRGPNGSKHIFLQVRRWTYLRIRLFIASGNFSGCYSYGFWHPLNIQLLVNVRSGEDDLNGINIRPMLNCYLSNNCCSIL